MTSSDTAILVALVGLAAAILGGLIQAISARGAENRRFERQAKWDLYTQYFLVLGELTFADEDTERHRNALSLMAQLRGRIGLIGSPDVIEAVGEIFRYPHLMSSDAQEAMARALETMRRDVGSRNWKVDHPAFVQLMFGSREADA